MAADAAKLDTLQIPTRERLSDENSTTTFFQRNTDESPGETVPYTPVDAFHQHLDDNCHLSFWRRINWLGTLVGACFILITFVFYILSAVQQNQTPSVWTESRLPKNVVPSRYTLLIHTDMSNQSYSGIVNIALEISSPTTIIVLNSVDLELYNTFLILPDGRAITPSRVIFNSTNEQVLFGFDQIMLAPGQYNLNISFRAPLRTDLRGYYLSTFIDPTQTTRYIATTQFEATDARRAFPCFDEPAMKAVFSLTMEASTTLQTLSNADYFASKPIPGTSFESTTFFDTPIMSTYLLAFMVLDGFFCLSKASAKGVQVYSCGPSSDDSIALDYPLQIGAAVVDFYSDYYNIPYPFTKLHLVAIPDFSAGAMENWGLITFAPTFMLADPARSLRSTFQRVATTVVHEIAHQWHGDFVTMAWWNDLWLNEGFATYHEYIGTAAVEPDWQLQWSQMYPIDTMDALAADALQTSRQIVPALDNIVYQSDIEQMFDTITYSKGGVVLRMIQAYADSLHPESQSYFKDRVTSYLSGHLYSSVTTKDLLTALDNNGNSRFQTSLLVNSWTNQAGFPLITVSSGSNGLLIQQTRFLSGSSSSSAAQTWQFPISIVIQNNFSLSPPMVVMITSASSSINIQQGQWFKVNFGQTVPGIVLYPSSNLLAIAATLSNNITVLPPIDRAGLVGDTFQLLRAGVLPATVALDYLEVLQYEVDFSVWAVAKTQLQFISRVISLSSAALGSAFKSYALGLIQPQLATISITAPYAQVHVNELKRATLLSLAVYFQEPATLATLLQIYNNMLSASFWDNNYSVYSADVISIAVTAAVQQGGQQEWNWAKTKYQTTISADEKDWLYQAMAASQDPIILQQTLDFAFNDPSVRPNDAPRLIAAVSRNTQGAQLAWDFVKANWDTLSQEGTGAFVLPSVLKNVISNAPPTQFVYDEIQGFFLNHEVAWASQSISAGLAQLAANINWVNLHSSEFVQALHIITRRMK